ncbi:MAG: hypothetical protein QXH07_07135 [Thermoplasmata archaeon]
MAVGKDKLYEIYKNVKTRRDFIAQCTEKYPQLKKTYISQVWYKFKAEHANTASTSNAVAQQTSESAQQTTDATVTTNGELSATDQIQPFSSEDVKTVAGEPVENKNLKEVYGNMFSEEGGGEEEEQEAHEEAEQEEAPTNVSVSPAQLLSSIAKGINNNLLYGNVKLIGDRPLTEDEMSTIDDFSSAVAKKDLKLLEDQPEINWAIASFMIPALNRIDLYFDKMINFIKKHPPRKQQQQQQQAQEQQQQQPKYSEEQLQTLQAWNEQGFRVDPAFDFKQPIDIVAYRDAKIVRNVGSKFE